MGTVDIQDVTGRNKTEIRLNNNGSIVHHLTVLKRMDFYTYTYTHLPM